MSDDIVERLRDLRFRNDLQDEAADTIEALRRERDELQHCATKNGEGMTYLREQLAASQAREQQLREALEKIQRLPYDEVPDHHQTIAHDALALPQDTTALNAWGAKLLRDAGYLAFLQSLDFDVYLNRVADELEQK